MKFYTMVLQIALCYLVSGTVIAITQEYTVDECLVGITFSPEPKRSGDLVSGMISIRLKDSDSIYEGKVALKLKSPEDSSSYQIPVIYRNNLHQFVFFVGNGGTYEFNLTFYPSLPAWSKDIKVRIDRVESTLNMIYDFNPEVEIRYSWITGGLAIVALSVLVILMFRKPSVTSM